MSKNSTSDSSNPSSSGATTKDTKPSAKKTEVIELRLSPDDKVAFMEACRMEGQSASSVLRDGISVYLKNGYFGENRRSYKMLISGFLMGAVAVTTVYIALPYFEERVPRAAAESFARHDSNVDGYISLGEFLAPLSNATNIVTIKSGTIKLEGETDILEGTADLKEKIETLISTQASTQINYKEVSEQVEADRKCREAMIAFNASNRTIEFGRLDEDSDNRLSLIEFSKSSYVPKRETIHAEFNSLDQNEDGILTRDEMETPFKPTTFTLKKAEWKNRVVTALPIPCLNRPHENADSVIIANIGPTVISDMASSSDDKFKELDENNDRKITLDEYLRANGVIL